MPKFLVEIKVEKIETCEIEVEEGETKEGIIKKAEEMWNKGHTHTEFEEIKDIRIRKEIKKE